MQASEPFGGRVAGAGGEKNKRLFFDKLFIG
jgi:hypothetical protein